MAAAPLIDEVTKRNLLCHRLYTADEQSQRKISLKLFDHLILNNDNNIDFWTNYSSVLFLSCYIMMIKACWKFLHCNEVFL